MIRTRKPNKRAIADQHLRPRNQWGWILLNILHYRPDADLEIVAINSNRIFYDKNIVVLFELFFGYISNISL